MNIKSFFSKIAIVAVLMGVSFLVSGWKSSSNSSNRHPGEPEMVFVHGGTFTM